MKNLIMILALSLCTCCNQQNAKEISKVVTENKDTTLAVVPDEQIIITPIAQKDQFSDKVHLLNDSLQKAGLIPLNDSLVTGFTDFDNHWWLKTFITKIEGFKRYGREAPPEFPDKKDFESITNIRRAVFGRKTGRYKYEDIFVEEWHFTDSLARDRWYKIASKNTKNDFTKPPKEFWIDGNSLYFVSVWSAKEWWEKEDLLLTIMAGKSAAELHRERQELFE